MKEGLEFGCINLKTNTSHKGYIDEKGEMAFKKKGEPFNPWVIVKSKNVTWFRDISCWIWSSPHFVRYARLLILEMHQYTGEKRAYYLEDNGERDYVDVNHAQGIMGTWF